MSRKIIGVTVGSPLPKPNLMQNDPKKGDYVKGKEEFLEQINKPSSGGNADVSIMEPMEDDIPKVFFVGTAPTSKAQDELPLTMEYISKTKRIFSYATLKVQGDSSSGYAKKNFNLKMFSDEARTEKQKCTFRDWLKTHKYCLKANWIDHTHARNVVNGRLWAQVVRSRADIADYPAEYQASPHCGAVDGFPVKVYVNGVYQGIYTWNIRKDESMFNMDDKTGTHAALIADANRNTTIWRELPNIDGTDWTDELNDVVPDAVLTGFRSAYSFVMNATDDEFKTNIEQYFYKSSLIDYYIFIYSILMIGGLAKSQTMFTYDAVKYLANIYDMDTTWALKWDGSGYYDIETTCPAGYIAQADTIDQNNLLYERLVALFPDEIATRYAELRASVLSDANIINEFERFTDVIGSDLYAEDFASTTANGAFTAIPSTDTNNIQKLRDIIVKRMAYCDVKIPNIGIPHPLSTGEITYSNGSVLRVSDANNISIKNVSSETQFMANVSDLGRNTPNKTYNDSTVNNIQDVWFTIPAGSTVTLKADIVWVNAVNNATIGLRKAGQSTSAISLTPVKNSQISSGLTTTVTFAEDTDISCMLIYAYCSPANVSFEASVEVYVDDVRWV